MGPSHEDDYEEASNTKMATNFLNDELVFSAFQFYSIFFVSVFGGNPNEKMPKATENRVKCFK